MLVLLHLGRVEARQESVLADLSPDELPTKGNGNLHGRLSLGVPIEPCLSETLVARPVEIDRGRALDIVALRLYLQPGQRVNDQPVTGNLFIKFFFCSSLHEERYMS